MAQIQAFEHSGSHGQVISKLSDIIRLRYRFPINKIIQNFPGYKVLIAKALLQDVTCLCIASPTTNQRTVTDGSFSRPCGILQKARQFDLVVWDLTASSKMAIKLWNSSGFPSNLSISNLGILNRFINSVSWDCALEDCVAPVTVVTFDLTETGLSSSPSHCLADLILEI